MSVLWFLAGGAVEVVNALVRKWSVGRLDPRHSTGAALWMTSLLFVIRLGWTGLVLVLAFRHSFASGAAAFVGYWLCRWLMIAWISKAG